MKKKTYTLEELNKMVEENDSLYLTDVTSIPERWNPTVRGDLYLDNLTSIPDDWCPDVRENLSLNSLTSIPEGWNPTVGDSLLLNSLTSIPRGWNPTVGGSLCLNGLTSIPEGWNPIVGGSLYLDSIKSIPKDFNPTVGGYLFLESVEDIPEGWNPTIGCTILYSHYSMSKNSDNQLREGTYVPGEYLYADGILTQVERCRKVGGYTYYIGKIKGQNVISDGKNYAHCGSFRDGVADLLFKSAADRGASQYEGLPLDTKLTVDEAVTMYRIITGACKQGSKRFVNNLGKLKEKYTIAEMLEITKEQFNSEHFAEFFGR